MERVQELGELIGSRVTWHRELQGLSQTDLLARLAEVDGRWSPAAISLLESRGARGERLSDVADLCIALNVSFRTLLGDEKTWVKTKSGTVRQIAAIYEAFEGPDGGR